MCDAHYTSPEVSTMPMVVYLVYPHLQVKISAVPSEWVRLDRHFGKTAPNGIKTDTISGEPMNDYLIHRR